MSASPVPENVKLADELVAAAEAVRACPSPLYMVTSDHAGVISRRATLEFAVVHSGCVTFKSARLGGGGGPATNNMMVTFVSPH
jgi:hypothetical protein